MGESSFDLTNSSNWSLSFQQSFNANLNDPTSSYAFIIGQQVIPILLTSSVIAVVITSTSASPTWKTAGFLQRQISINLPDLGSRYAYLPGSETLLLNTPNLIVFDNLISTYEISIRPHDWIQQADVKLYKYVSTA